MRRRPSALEQSGNPENERAGAHRGDILRGACLPADELDRIRSPIAPTTPRTRPGMQIRSRGGQFAKVRVGRRLSPQSLGTGAADLATMWVVD